MTTIKNLTATTALLAALAIAPAVASAQTDYAANGAHKCWMRNGHRICN